MKDVHGTTLPFETQTGLQAGRLQRELERMEAERDRAREDARRLVVFIVYLPCLSGLRSQGLQYSQVSHLDNQLDMLQC